MADIDLIFPVFNNQTLRNVTQDFRPYIQPGDVFTVNTGVMRGVADPDFVRATAQAIREVYPQNLILARTAGKDHVKRLADSLDPAVCRGIVYTYEPNQENIPEFTVDFNGTLNNIREAREATQKRGLQFWTMLTSRPVMERRFLVAQWDYGKLIEEADATIVQTQTWCRQGQFPQAMQTVERQRSSAAGQRPWHPLLAVGSPGGPLRNGISPEESARCALLASSQGHRLIGWQWVPDEINSAIQFLKLIGRQPK